MRLFETGALSYTCNLLHLGYSNGVIMEEEDLVKKGRAVKCSPDMRVKKILINRLLHTGMSLKQADIIAQDSIRGCKVMEWDPSLETTYIWISLEDPDDFVLLPDYEFDSVGFVPDPEKTFLIIPLRPIYSKVLRLAGD